MCQYKKYLQHKDTLTSILIIQNFVSIRVVGAPHTPIVSVTAAYLRQDNLTESISLQVSLEFTVALLDWLVPKAK